MFGRFVGWIVLVLIFVAMSVSGRASAGDEDPSKPTCWKRPVPEGVDPCVLFERARDLQGSLPRAVETYVKELADGLELERSLRVQEALLREHLAWQNEHLTRQQIDLLVFVSVAISLERVESRSDELEREFVENNDPETKRRVNSVELYSDQAWTLLVKLSSSLANLRKSDLKFGV